MTRYTSDDIVTPRSSAHPPSLLASRPQEHISHTSESSSSSLNAAHIPSATPVRQKSPLAPLVVPPRTDTLPQISTSQESASYSSSTLDVQNSTSNNPKYSHFTHGYNDSIMSTMTYSSGTPAPPQAYQRKSSISESINSVSSNATGFSAFPPTEVLSSAATYNGGYPASQRNDQSPQLDVPQSAPVIHTNTILHTPQTATPKDVQMHSGQPPPEIQASTPIPDPTSSLIPPSTRAFLSRDSRITLPDEARQYIANMTDSPLPSPGVDALGPGSRQAVHGEAAVKSVESTISARSGDTSEFLDFDEEDDAGEDFEELDSTAPEDGIANVDTVLSGPEVPSSMAQPSVSTSAPKSMESEPFVQAPPRKSSNHPPEEFSQPQSSTSPPYLLPQYAKEIRTNSTPQKTGSPNPPQPTVPQSVNGPFRALPLLFSDLPHTKINVSHSFVRPNDRGKEVLSFIVHVDPGKSKGGWKVEKMYSHVLTLDQRVRSSIGKGVGKKIAALPEGKLWRDHAPAKVDQRKAVLENYLQTLINLPVKNNDEVIAFFTSDIVKETMQPVMQAGHKEGYLTKRGKNFGGWKTRYFVLQGPVLEYFDCRGGTHLGSINVTGAQIGRQQRNPSAAATDDEKEYRHAFLIVEAKKGPGGNHPRHVLCAESDVERDSWVEILVRYFSGTYSEEPVAYGPGPTQQPRPSASNDGAPPRRLVRGLSRDDMAISKGQAIPISQLPPDVINAKFFQSGPAIDDVPRSTSPSKPIDMHTSERQQLPSSFSDSQTAKRILERGYGQPSSFPDSSPISNPSASGAEAGQRANSELGHYPDMNVAPQQPRRHSPERHRARDQLKPFPHVTTGDTSSSPTASSPSDRVPSPEKLDANSKIKISGPLNGAPIPAGYKFGGKESSSETTSASTPLNDRREKAKSRSFWGFGKQNGVPEKPVLPSTSFTPRAVFGVALEESLDVAQIVNLPAIVFRCIQYLEVKKADQEEGIYRLSGSSAVIKSLKDRFNLEGDIDLIASDEYWDPHAIAGLLKSYLRELPASILTRELHVRFLAVIDFVDPQERIRELSQLIAALPIANYSLLRALTAHLILIVQNSAANKMTMRNVGIVFSPTLGIPAGVFSLMLGEFNRVFNVDGDKATNESTSFIDDDRRNSRQYSEAAADQLLGLSGRTLNKPADEVQSDTDDLSSVQEESSNESSSRSSPSVAHSRLSPPDTPLAPAKSTKASSVAATKGLNLSISTSERGNRHSRMMGLPHSPRPPHSPSHQSPPQ
ncbi:hypothetical protein E1B28_007496 [Marasmius oreades]|uniref:RhoGAP-domain-containing protein n=1 Tax=Marasmius oreades TaxID=181124 RepID=A0A9P7UTU3_9AGAR|nr:uncharacterized protein E1B28_007496 [Marasmius oreades]KAG7093858.1 hypothetical protein E1B28_007496 [Marasmius oreades]